MELLSRHDRKGVIGLCFWLSWYPRTSLCWAMCSSTEVLSVWQNATVFRIYPGSDVRSMSPATITCQQPQNQASSTISTSCRSNNESASWYESSVHLSWPPISWEPQYLKFSISSISHGMVAFSVVRYSGRPATVSDHGCGAGLSHEWLEMDW